MCLRLSSLEASHNVCSPGLIAPSILCKPCTLLSCLIVQQSADVCRFIINAIHSALQHEVCLQLSCTFAEQVSRFSIRSCCNRASHFCCFKPVVLNVLLLACMPCITTDPLGRIECIALAANITDSHDSVTVRLISPLVSPC